MTRFASSLPLLALVSAAPLAAQAARDFQLPPAPSPTETRVQGPVDTDAPVPVRPRAIETARPTPSPAATQTQAPAANTTPAIALPTPAPARSGATEAAPARSLPPQATPTVAATLAPPLASPSAIAPSPAISPAPSVTAGPAPSPVPQPERSLPWLGIALGGLALAGAAGAFVAWRRRRAAPRTPDIIVPQAAPPASLATAPAEALALAVEAVRMDRSVLNATVGYRVTVRNRTAQALTGVAVEADLVSASRERPADQQVASPSQALTPRHAAERLAPGQSLRFEGQVRLPLSEATAIWQGRAALLVPLLRVRATAAGSTPVATTLVIGRAEGSTARPQPFRLDEPPRSYAPLAQRVLDAVPARP